MKPLSEYSFWKKYYKFSIWVLIFAGLTAITILAGLPAIKKLLFEPLPTWEVNDPVSKVFAMDEIPPTAGSLAAGNASVPDAYLVDPSIDSLFLLMETQGVYFHKTATRPSGIVGSNDVVILKGNFQWSGRSTTNTDRIKGVIWQILQHPDGFSGEILVGDNTQHTSIDEDDNNSEDQEQSIIDVVNTFHAKGYPVYLFNWTLITHNVITEYSEGDYNDGYTYDPASKITYPKFQSPEGTYISLKYGIWDSTSQVYNLDRLCLINLPVPKSHGYTGATIALKNWMGVLSIHDLDGRYGGGHSMHYTYMFGEFALVTKVMGVTFPKLTIVDAEWTNPSSNQHPNSSLQTKMLLGSTDPCAVSWYAAKYVLYPISSGSTNPDNPNGKYHSCINNWTTNLQDSGFAVTIDSSEISVYDRSVLSVTSTFSLTVTVNNGWNMVSVPGVNSNGQGVDTWWSGKDPAANVYKYSNSNGYTPITTTVPTEGYWMKHLGANEYNTGDEWPAGGIEIVAHNPINAITGWNLIGGYENTVSTGGLTTTPPGLIDGQIYEYSNGYTVAMNLKPGYGYWIKLTGSGNINIPAVPLAKGSEEVVEYFKEDWGKITITDNADRSYTLYAVKGEVNLNSFELPPVPPSGIFDIRFASNRIAENLNSAFQTIQMTGIEHPIKVKVENINIRLQDETGKEINENLKSGKEVTISQSTINNLIVTRELIPDEYALEQNYPNPFNPSTTIKYHIPELSFVTLKVYDVLGNEITTLVSEEKSIGSFEIMFDATGFPSGIYFYRLQAGSFVETKKMLMIK